MVGIGGDAVHWGKIGEIVVSWIVTPMIAGFAACVVCGSVQWLIIGRENPLERARRYVPVYIFLAGFTITLVTIFKGLKHAGLSLSTQQAYLLATVFGILIALIGKFFINRIEIDEKADREFHFATVEKVFGVLMIVTACGMAFAHGSNDVANAVGPVAAVISIAKSGIVGQESPLPLAVLFLGGIGIVVVLATFGRHVIATVGSKIIHLTPSRGFAAELAAASTIVMASSTGMPISTTQTLVGAVLGVGMARGITAINLAVVNRIFISWVITIPAGAILAIIFFYILKAAL